MAEDSPADWSVVGEVYRGSTCGPAVSGYGANIPKTADTEGETVPLDTGYYETGRGITG